jgi:hypothetical protein
MRELRPEQGRLGFIQHLLHRKEGRTQIFLETKEGSIEVYSTQEWKIFYESPSKYFP